jgi:hypothetical protein
MTGSVSILNVGAGGTKLTFDKSNPAEAIRAARIVKDMIRRGYALLVEVDGVYRRAHDFVEDSQEYIIADFDPTSSQSLDDGPPISQPEEFKSDQPSTEEASGEAEAPPAPAAKNGRRRTIPASSARVVAVGRSAGG